MCKYSIFCLLLSILFVSCDDGDSPYSYLDGDKVEAAVVKFDLNVSSCNTEFYYLFQARELYMIWGNTDKNTEYILPKNTSIDSIKPISHIYPNAGVFQATLKGLGLKRIDISKTTEDFASNNTNNTIATLSLKDCVDLIDLRFSGQPIDTVDVTNCVALNTLHCGFSEGAQEIIGLDYLTNLNILHIYGSLGKPQLNFSDNDSLKTLMITGADCSTISLEYLVALQSIEFYSLPKLSEIKLLQNTQLNSIILRDNQTMDELALNKLFGLLPMVTGTDHFITLSGNKGDNSCDKSLATAKGWIFK